MNGILRVKTPTGKNSEENDLPLPRDSKRDLGKKLLVLWLGR